MLDRIHSVCAAISGTILALMVVGIVANIALRNLAGAPIYGLLDLVEYGLLVVTFLGAPWVLSRNGHVVVDVMTGALRERTARRLARIVGVLGLAVSVVVVIYATQALATSFARGSVIRTAFNIPEWWVLSVMPVSFCLIALEFLRQVISPPVGRAGPTGL